MKQLFLLFLFSSLLLSQTTNDPYKNIKYFTLNNGLKVYMLSNKKSVNTKLSIEVNVGSALENKTNAGIIHLVEHIVFRDKNIPYNDYLDFLKEKGATEVNARTEEYKTIYYATMNSEKTKFLLKNFLNMLFHKNVTTNDLEIEKKALQTEIGELVWSDKLSYYLSTLKHLFPNRYDIYKDDFSLQIHEFPHQYFYKSNNKKYTLQEVMKYYNEYYYPANMTLKIAGNFNDKEIINYIKKHFGQVTKKGTKTLKELPYNAKLNNISSSTYLLENDNNIAYIGAKLLNDSEKKYQIISAYTDHLANRMQQKLRNNLGQTYSVNSFYYGLRNATLMGISFDSLHESFNENIKLVKQQIKQDSIKLDTSVIKAALKEYGHYYRTLENDTKTLHELIDTLSYIHKTHNVYDKTPYEIYKSITIEDFQKTVSSVFSGKNDYIYVYRDYYIFPFDYIILSLLSLIVHIYIFIYIAKSILYLKKSSYPNREIILTRRVSSRFFSVLFFLLASFIALIIFEWSGYIFETLILNNRNFILSIDSFYAYIIEIAILTILFILSLITIFRFYFAKLELTKNTIYIIGTRIISIKKEDIKKIEKVNWSLEKFFKICGFSFLFFKDLVLIETNEGEFYLRTSNAKHLEEDLLKWSR